MTALMWASYYGDIEMVKLIIKNDAVVDLQDDFNRTALDFAEESNFEEVVKYLKESIDNTYIKEFTDKYGKDELLNIIQIYDKKSP